LPSRSEYPGRLSRTRAATPVAAVISGRPAVENPNDRLRSESRPTVATCAPESTDYDLALVEGVVQVASDLRDIQAPDAWDTALRIGRSGAWQERRAREGLLRTQRRRHPGGSGSQSTRSSRAERAAGRSR
jgi:hypothetical protein